LPVDRARLATLPGQPPPDVPLLCLDTETTGLATAAGTLAFLVGLGWWDGGVFRQVQLLLPDHADEPALLAELARLVPPAGWLVTYNGRGFDWPLLVARYRLARAAVPPLAGHLDLLPFVRRTFRHRMPDARLRTAESVLLGVERHRDVEGWEIPARYLEFLRFGEPDGLLDVVVHNHEDVRSLARLVAHVETRLGDAAARAEAPPGDLAGLARAFLRERRLDEALACLECALDLDDAADRAEPEHRVAADDDGPWWSPRRRPDFGGRPGRQPAPGTWRAAERSRLDAPWTRTRLLVERARILARQGRALDAATAWAGIADLGGQLGALAWVEVAKLREHRLHDLAGAATATETASRLIERARRLGRPAPRLERDLVRRAGRLRRRAGRATLDATWTRPISDSTAASRW